MERTRGTLDLDLDAPRLRAARATASDAAALQACFDAARDYFALVERRAPRADEAQQLLADAEADPDRAVILLSRRDRGGVVGVLDLHLDYPEPGTAHVGLLLFRRACQGQGLGRETCVALERALAAAGYSTLRLSVVDENTSAKAFWERLGFCEAGRLERRVTLYEKQLDEHRAAAQPPSTAR